MTTFTKKMQDETKPSNALELLVQGNNRFMANTQVNRNLMDQASQTANGQFPFAVVLSCIDSRASVEHIFDQGIGDVFSIRVAGNVINEDVLGSMEFGCKAAGSKIIVVLGHSACGAVKGACDHVELGNLTALLNKIEPAVNDEKTETVRDSSNATFVAKVTEINIRKTVLEVLEKSPVLKEMVNKGEVGIVGANHDLASGKITFFEDTFQGIN